MVYVPKVKTFNNYFLHLFFDILDNCFNKFDIKILLFQLLILVFKKKKERKRENSKKMAWDYDRIPSII